VFGALVVAGRAGCWHSCSRLFPIAGALAGWVVVPFAASANNVAGVSESIRWQSIPHCVTAGRENREGNCACCRNPCHVGADADEARYRHCEPRCVERQSGSTVSGIGGRSFGQIHDRSYSDFEYIEYGTASADSNCSCKRSGRRPHCEAGEACRDEQCTGGEGERPRSVLLVASGSSLQQRCDDDPACETGRTNRCEQREVQRRVVRCFSVRPRRPSVSAVLLEEQKDPDSLNQPDVHGRCSRLRRCLSGSHSSDRAPSFLLREMPVGEHSR